MKKADLLAEVNRVVATYSQATGVDCVVIETKTPQFTAWPMSQAGRPETCQTCPSLQTDRQAPSCMSTQRYQLSENQEPQRYIYLCHSGFAFWGGSILFQGQTLANILAYSSLSKDEIAATQLKNELDIKTSESLHPAPKRIRSLAELLHVCCELLSEPHNLATGPLYPTRPHKDLSTAKNHLGEYDIQTILDRLNSDLNEVFQKEILIEPVRIPEPINKIQAKIVHISSWLTEIARHSGLLDSLSLDQQLRELKRIENSKSLEKLNLWLNNLTNLFYKRAFRLENAHHGDALAKSLRYIHQEYRKEISMQHIADIVEMSYSYFSRIFKKEIGVSFNEYVNKLRIDKSCQILISTDKNLLDVAHECGFRDQSYYTKTFKRVMNMSPRKFRVARRRVPQDN